MQLVRHTTGKSIDKNGEYVDDSDSDELSHPRKIHKRGIWDPIARDPRNINVVNERATLDMFYITFLKPRPGDSHHRLDILYQFKCCHNYKHMKENISFNIRTLIFKTEKVKSQGFKLEKDFTLLSELADNLQLPEESFFVEIQYGDGEKETELLTDETDIDKFVDHEIDNKKHPGYRYVKHFNLVVTDPTEKRRVAIND
jgi:hypothetical protein